MSNVDYDAMSNEELRRYFLRHREDASFLSMTKMLPCGKTALTFRSMTY
ncbi:hypothetical protein CAL7102_08671 [Dulcicalothrix desertica PCC 7102]|nr:hypothetical protein CAL7102_08671 [Dulcicalothrix desertica PCC 7102]